MKYEKDLTNNRPQAYYAGCTNIVRVDDTASLLETGKSFLIKVVENTESFVNNHQ